jgi:two-component system, LytTR family, response regulator
MKSKNHLRKLNCLLVEDEQHDIDTIVRFITNHERLHHIGTTIVMSEFSKMISSNKIDIIFLDNKLGDAPHLRNAGLDFLDTLINLTAPNPIPYIISISQYPEDYKKALELNVWSVISKPMSEENFITKVGRVIEIIDDKDEIERLRTNIPRKSFVPYGKIPVKLKGTNQKQKFVDLSNIIYLESVSGTHELKIHLSEPLEGSNIVLTTNSNFTTLEGFLEGKINDGNSLSPKQLQYFGRINKSCIINLCYIDGIEANTINLREIEKPLSFINNDYRKKIMLKYKEVFSQNLPQTL